MSRLVITSFVVALLAIPAVSGTTLGATQTCFGLEATIVGTDNAEVIHGTDGRDVIVAGDGNDWVYGEAGFDVICGGEGRDRIFGNLGRNRIFGNRGKDILKGGRGFDRLNGGKSLDGCYPGADGGSVVECEDADLRVSIFAPSSRPEGAAISATIRVRNVGSRPSRPFKLFVTEVQRRADCGADHSFDVEWTSLKPGEWRQWPASHPGGCQITGADPFIRINAQVRQGARDARRSNNSDSARIDIDP